MRRVIFGLVVGLLLFGAPASAHAQLGDNSQNSQTPNTFNINPGQSPAASNGAVLPGAPGPVVYGAVPTGAPAAQSSFTTSMNFAQANNTPFANDNPVPTTR